MGQGLALVEQKVPNGGFEALKRDMTGQVGVEPSSLEGFKQVGQGLALVEPKVPKGNFETVKRGMTGQVGVEPSS